MRAVILHTSELSFAPQNLGNKPLICSYYRLYFQAVGFNAFVAEIDLTPSFRIFAFVHNFLSLVSYSSFISIKMKALPSDVQLSLFKVLDSNDMVRLSRVSKTWLEVLENNDSLWKRLILSEKENGWDLSILELFDRKSNHSLKEISIHIKMEREELVSLYAFLIPSRKTLRFLTISISSFFTTESGIYQLLTEQLNVFPHLVECRLGDVYCGPVQLQVKDADENVIQGSNLKVLWTCREERQPFISSFRHLNNLKSFRLTGALGTRDARALLQGPSQSLRHLDIFDVSDHLAPTTFTLDFPRLQVLEIASRSQAWPSWLIIPPSTTVVTFCALVNFPSISKLWLENLSCINRLASRCPTLVELRIVSDSFSIKENIVPSIPQQLINMLLQRRRFVEEGFKVEGIEMVKLKALVLPFKLLTKEFLSSLEELVEEVVDLETVSRSIKNVI